MFQALIRRKLDQWSARPEEIALESTTFSLSTEVPRPTDQRTEERLLAILPVAKLVTDGSQDFCRIKNISAGGLMGEAASLSLETGTELFVELNSNQRIPGTVVWKRETTIGIKFDQNVDIRELLANRRPRHGFRPRPPRLDVTCGASVKIGELYHKTEIRDISLGGVKVMLSDWQCVGKPCVITIESLRPVKGHVQWYKGQLAGIVFDKPLTFDELAEWMGKRVELASLRSGAWDRNPKR
jgi:PilZ domain